MWNPSKWQFYLNKKVHHPKSVTHFICCVLTGENFLWFTNRSIPRFFVVKLITAVIHEYAVECNIKHLYCGYLYMKRKTKTCNRKLKRHFPVTNPSRSAIYRLIISIE